MKLSLTDLTMDNTAARRTGTGNRTPLAIMLLPLPYAMPCTVRLRCWPSQDLDCSCTSACHTLRSQPSEHCHFYIEARCRQIAGSKSNLRSCWSDPRFNCLPHKFAACNCPLPLFETPQCQNGECQTHLISIPLEELRTHMLPGGAFVSYPRRPPLPGFHKPQGEVHDMDAGAGQCPAVAVDHVQPQVCIVTAAGECPKPISNECGG